MSVILLIVIPLAAAFLSILSKKTAPYLLVSVNIFNLVLLIFFAEFGTVIIGGFEFPYGINLFFDAYAKISLILLNGLFFIVVLLNIKDYKKFSTILLIALVGLNGLLLTGDLFNRFIFLEIASISAYLVTTSHHKPLSTFNYLVMGTLGTSLYLFGLAILYAMFGTLNFMDLVYEIQISDISYQSLTLPFFLMFIGLGVKVKLLPLNSWVKGILKHSNTLSGPLIASVYAAAISIFFGRLITNLFIFEGHLLTIVLILLVAGVFLGEAMAFSTNKAREILLFSSISQASIVVLLFVHGIIIWAVYLIIANALAKAVMYFIINKAVEKTSDDDVDSLKGLFKKNTIAGIAFTVSALSIAGMPLFVGFIIKLNYLTILANQQNFIIVGVILISSLVEGIYFMKMLVKLWFKGDNEIDVTYNLSSRAFFVVITLVIIFFGSYSAPLNKLDNSIDTMQDKIDEIYYD